MRAWRSAEGFEGRSSLRSWLYRIATNVCIDMLRSVQRRARPMEMGPDSPPVESLLGPMLGEAMWVTPVPDASVAPDHADPADVADYRESIRLAFVTALQHLPARQRAALILADVLRWQVAEVADLMDTSVPAINSALQRARATLRSDAGEGRLDALDDRDSELLERYVDAFQRYDIDGWSTCSTRTPCSRCRRSPSGCAARRTSVGGWSSPAQRLSRIAPAADHGQRLPGLRSVPRRSLGRVRPLGHPGSRGHRWPHLVHEFLPPSPPARAPLPLVRPPAPSRRMSLATRGHETCRPSTGASPGLR